MTAIAALILELMSPMRDPRLAYALAPIIVEESKAVEVNPRIVVSMIFSESTFRARAVGKHGEVGLMQILPITAVAMCNDLLPKLHLARENVRCGLRVMVAARAKCGDEPLRWLSRYNGGPCRTSGYSRRILARLKGAGV